MTHTGPSHIVARVLAGIFGSWLFVSGLISVGILLLVRLGMSYSDAQTFMFLLGGVALLTAFLWAFAATRLSRVWLVLGGGGLIMGGVAWGLVRASH